MYDSSIKVNFWQSSSLDPIQIRTDGNAYILCEFFIIYQRKHCFTFLYKRANRKKSSEIIYDTLYDRMIERHMI